MRIIYEDNHLLIAEKPPNILSQGDRTKDPDMLALLKEDIKIRYNKPGNVFLGLVHRLDRPVGGVMAFARTSKAASRLSDQIRQGTFKKIYYAVIRGIPSKSPSVLEHYLYKDAKKNIVRVVDEASGLGKKALLSYEVIGMSKEYNLSCVKIHLYTGRPHQIRVQFASIGHPIFGDQKYGYKQDKQQIALWAGKITFIHPTTKEELSFHSPPPDEHPWNLFKLEAEN
jgi:23S rRNA pseudouridine1911/1915/1917 synthase